MRSLITKIQFLFSILLFTTIVLTLIASYIFKDATFLDKVPLITKESLVENFPLMLRLLIINIGLSGLLTVINYIGDEEYSHLTKISFFSLVINFIIYIILIFILCKLSNKKMSMMKLF